MTTTTLLLTALLALAPISELRGAIPFAVLRGISLPVAVLISIGFNALVPLVVFVFLSTLHKFLYRWNLYRGFFDRFVEKTRMKVHPKVEKYGYLGLLLFVAIPLPVTGAWTGTLGAWILGMQKRKAVPAIIAGVCIAGIIVGIMVFAFGAGTRTIFFKQF